MTPTRLTFRAPILAADAGRRRIAGRLVTYGVEGSTSYGPVVFHGPPADLDVDAVRLVYQHDDERPLGRAVELTDTDGALDGAFRVANTSAGTDALVEASERLRDGLSVGAHVIDGEVDDLGVLHVAAGGWLLAHVGLVTSPAFTDSRVAEVAAAHTAPDPQPDSTDTPEVPAMEEHEQNTTEAGNAPAPEAPAEVAAAAPEAPAEVHAANPSLPVQVRDREVAPITAGRVVQLTVAAQQGDADARRLLTAATGTSDVAGLIPTPQARDVVGIIDDRRFVVDTVERRDLPASGTQFQVPVRETKSGVTVIADADLPALADSGGAFDWLTVDVEMIAGKDTLTVHAIERSDPSVIDDLLTQFAESYAQQSDQFVADALLAGAVASQAADYPAAFTQAIVDSAGVTRQAPAWLLLGLTSWQTLKGLRHTDDRAVFPRLSERNAQGTLAGDPFTDGDVEGLATRVSLNLTAADTMAAYPSTALRFYEGSGIAQVRAMQVGALTWEIGVYGYVAALAKYPTAVRAVSLSA